MSRFLTFDIGTTAVKACLFDEYLSLLCSHSFEYQLLYPSTGCVELESETYWRCLCAAARQVLSACSDPSEITMITLTTQGETLIPVGGNGRALSNAIVWLDARSEEESEILNERIGSEVLYRHTGIPEFNPTLPICKLLWFKRNKPELYEKTHTFCLLEDYLIFRLTGVFVTNPTLLCSTGYFDIMDKEYWEEALEASGVEREKLPLILPNAVVAGSVCGEGALDTGLAPGTPVSTGGMDQAASALGSGNFKPGIVTETTGTCLFAAATVEKPDWDISPRSSYYLHVNGKYLLVAYNQAGAIILKWFRDEFMPEFHALCVEKNLSVYDEMCRLAESVPMGSGGLILVPHFAGKLVPDVNGRARGVFFGVSLETGRAHFIRAILEGIACMLRENIDSLEACGITGREIRTLGGGARSRVWNAIKADITGREIVSMKQNESASLGAAMMGALAAGCFGSFEEMEMFLIKDERFLPRPENRLASEALYNKYLEVYHALAAIF